MPTPVFCCGAECGIVAVGASGSGLRHWSTVTGSPTAETTGAIRSGARAYKFTTAGGAVVAFRHLLATTPTIAVARFYVYFESLPSANCFIANFLGGVNWLGVLFNQADSKIYAAAATAKGATGVAVTTGQWYRIDFKANVSANPNLGDVSVDGTAAAQMSQPQAAATISQFIVGGNTDTTTANFTHRIEDILVSVTSGDFPLGAGQVVGLSPTGDGTHSFSASGDFDYNGDTGTPVVSGATDTYSYIDELPMTGIADFIGADLAETGEYLAWTFADTVGSFASVNGVEVVSAHHAAATQANKQSMRISDDAWTSSTDVFADSDFSQTTIVYQSNHLATKPSGGAWTQAALDAVQTRWGSSWTATDVTPDCYIDGLLLEVDYVPAAGDTISPSAIASSEAFGTPKERLTLPTVGGLATGQAFGSTRQVFLLTGLTGIVSGEAFGTPKELLILLPSGLASGEAIGSHTVQGGAVIISPTGIVSEEAFGTHKQLFRVTLVGITSAEAFGIAKQILSLLGVGAIPSGETFGSHRQTFLVSGLAGISSAEVFGTGKLIFIISPTAFGGEAFGSVEVQGGTPYVGSWHNKRWIWWG